MIPGIVAGGASAAASPVTWNSLVAALPSLWGWWKLDETAGAAVTATDASGNARHGTYNASGTRGAGLFSGSTYSQTSLGSRVDVPDWTVASTPKFTVGAMIKTTHSAAAEQQIFSGDGGGGSRVFQFNKDTSTHALGATFISPSVVTLVGATAVNDGNAHLAMFVYDESLPAASGRMKLYLDGSLDAQSTTSITLTSGVVANLAIGARNGLGTGTWSGAIDEAFFCTAALSSTQIADLWAARNS